MGFLDTIKERNTVLNKAAAYDQMVREQEAKSIYEKGLADSANELAMYLAAQEMQKRMPQPMVEQDMLVDQGTIGIPAPAEAAPVAQRGPSGLAQNMLNK